MPGVVHPLNPPPPWKWLWSRWSKNGHACLPSRQVPSSCNTGTEDACSTAFWKQYAPAAMLQLTMLSLTAGPCWADNIPSGYTPSPYQPGWEVWAGAIALTIPFIIGAWEFGKRILIQKRCKTCSGRGLVASSRPATKYLRKCPECGGFFPWISWKMFLTSTTAPGNGGPLQQPRGQTSIFYTVPPEEQDSSTTLVHVPEKPQGSMQQQQQQQDTAPSDKS